MMSCSDHLSKPGNGSYNTSNLLSPNNSEEPLPPEPQPTTIPIQQWFSESDDIPITRPEQDTCGHTTSDDLTPQPLHDGSSGQIVFSQLEMKTQVIVNFNTEYSTDLYQQQSDLPEDLSPSTLVSLSHVVVPLQESSNGQSNMTELGSIYQATEVISEEKFVISPAN